MYLLIGALEARLIGALEAGLIGAPETGLIGAPETRLIRLMLARAVGCVRGIRMTRRE
ncbi:MAG TPA: hypothetical protein VKS44_04945 [Candidatus Acidoferrales bacterium]|nr:hypothetical protein [Candidatus Acidoferrales bacterium]